MVKAFCALFEKPLLTICYKDILICLLLKVHCFICHKPTKIDIYEYYDLGIQFSPQRIQLTQLVFIENIIIFSGHSSIADVINKLTPYVGVCLRIFFFLPYSISLISYIISAFIIYLGLNNLYFFSFFSFFIKRRGLDFLTIFVYLFIFF